MFKAKKLIWILATFGLLTGINKEDNIVLKNVLYIYYLFRFYKNKKNNMQPLINSSNKINVITPAFISKLGLRVCRTNVKDEKINSPISKSLK